MTDAVSEDFGQLIEQAMNDKGISQGKLAMLVGFLPDGRYFDATQIRLLKQGRRRLDRDIVGRLIVILDLDPDVAWQASGLWPEGLERLDLRRLRALASDDALREVRELVDRRLAAGGSGNPVCIIPRAGQRVRVLALVA